LSLTERKDGEAVAAGLAASLRRRESNAAVEQSPAIAERGNAQA